ncbi:L-gulonolactone oxidase 3 [Selaginella moellendorffii]|uniref:L-gulonolactone oxidase 3 n=1 Tax=Selaginella moellendorffii TaxID=88036 RepID=UPI000D1C873D|nr:L-gulonolactone oxidase 3 [Selaginella moellendorffii]|eukprot:XP_024540872.1 L-gulonolactone oxidase 3 [Selaginella moellendorffii]
MKFVLLALLFSLNLHLVRSLVECDASGCELKNYLRGPWPDRRPCKITKAFFPTNEAELLDAVAYAVKSKQKIKVISREAHTMTKFACPNSGSDTGGVVISTASFNSNSSVVVDKSSMTVSTPPGIMLGELMDLLAMQGVTLHQTIDWDGASPAGMVSTGAHGSSLWSRGGGTYEYLVSTRIVVPASEKEGFAKVVTVAEGSDLFHAARISLGVLGAISHLTFSVQPMTKRSVTLSVADDASLEDDFLRLAREHEFGEVLWYSSQKKYVWRTDDRAPLSVPGNGALIRVPFLPVQAAAARSSRLSQEAAETIGNSTFFCSAAKNTVNTITSTGGGFVNDEQQQRFSGFPVVGYFHKFQARGGCQYTYSNSTNLALPESERLVCGWDFRAHGQFWFHVSVSISISDVGNFIRDVKQLRDLSPERLCLLDTSIALQIRYLKASQAYLGPKTDAAQIEFITFRDRRPGEPQTYEDVAEEIEQLLLFKYNGKPHFGKNRPHAFQDIGRKTKNLSKFLSARRKLDPQGWFSSDWSDAVLGIRGSPVTAKDGCALEGLCVCSEARHCAPDKGYFCKPGLVYHEARVCSNRS